jgi:hypothetical protein
MLICERANSVEDAIRRGQRQVEQVRIKMGLQMDDKTFQAALLETQVFRPFYRGDLLDRQTQETGYANKGSQQVEF